MYRVAPRCTAVAIGRDADRDRRHAAGRRRRRHLRGRQVGDGARRSMGHDVRLCAGEVDALRYQARLVPADALHLPAGGARHRRRVRPGQRPGRRAARDRPAGRPAAAGPRATGSGVTGSSADRRERLGDPDAPAARRRAAPPGRGDAAADHRPPPRLLVGARALRELRRARDARGGLPARPARASATSASTASPRPSCASDAASSPSVIPNVFDFDQPRPRRTRRCAAGCGASWAWTMRGLLVVQPTRVVPRKGIELAIELVGRLERSRRRPAHHQPGRRRGARLPRRARAAGRAARGPAALRRRSVRARPRGQARSARPTTLHDAYLAADLITYPSLYEGYGNALIEAIFYGMPVAREPLPGLRRRHRAARASS